jgi:hypothetical protein
LVPCGRLSSNPVYLLLLNEKMVIPNLLMPRKETHTMLQGFEKWQGFSTLLNDPKTLEKKDNGK